ncbi:hypothetical protein A6P39_033025 [Streptomyces sp. FXJ1.172]|uniref:hypothetical protein n=1 Tax=Streptomyces sp. FXJ1.172 TaxID=710705 RepID=UPI0007CF6732|nr:hypothetical protein [Streptomyces sp. FXJ1.172]WEO98483.1 hypothetical protein A6P39_033025 [Streptomyces sp. FXJ1.172]
MRRIAAIQLVQWATQASVAEAAHFLGVDAERTLYTQDNIRIWLNSTHEVKDCGLALRDLAAEFEGRTHGLIDYQRRREALRDWSLTSAAWQHLTSQLGPPHGKQPVLDARKRQDASVFVWVYVTRGEHLFAPRLIEAEQPPHVQKRWTARRNTTWHQLTGPNPGPHYIALRQLLTEYAEQLAQSIDSGKPATMP